MKYSNLTNHERNFNVSQLASKSIRAFNFLIDTLIVSGIYYFIESNIGFQNSSTSFVVIFIIYYVFSEYLTGKTIGKYITKTTVITDSGKKLTFIKALGISISRLIPFEPLSCLLNTKAYGWHDSLSKTIVIPDDNL